MHTDDAGKHGREAAGNPAPQGLLRPKVKPQGRHATHTQRGSALWFKMTSKQNVSDHHVRHSTPWIWKTRICPSIISQWYHRSFWRVPLGHKEKLISGLEVPSEVGKKAFKYPLG